VKIHNVVSLISLAVSIVIFSALHAAGSPLPAVRYEFYSWKWAGDAAKAYRGAGENPQYLPKNLPMGELTTEEKARGFTVFRTHWMERTFPITVPKREQIADVIRIFASQGEFEPATFLIRPQRPLQNVLIELGNDLISSNGARIPKSNVRLGIVNGWTKYGNYYKPIRTAIAPVRAVDIDKDYSEQFWMTIKIPEDAKPGVYKGAIDIRVAGSRAHQLVLEVEVLPIKLLEPDAAFGMYFDHTRIPSQWATAEYMEKYYRDMAEHGMTSVTLYNTHGKMDGEKVAYDFAHNLRFKPGDPRYNVGLDVMMDLARKAGLLHKNIPVMYLGFAVDYSWISKRWKELNIPWPGGTPNAEECKVIAQHAREKGWPELLFYLMDEKGGINPYWGPRMMLWMREVIRPIKAAGLKTVDATGFLYKKKDYKKWYAKNRKLDKHELVVNEQGWIVDELVLENIYHWLDITLFSTTMGMEERVFDKMRALKKDYWGYDCAECSLHPESDRFMFGLYTWRIGAKGFWQWHYAACEVRKKDGKMYWPWMDEKGVFHNMGDFWPLYVVLSPLGPIPTISWEAKREGIDDYRYLLTLSDLIARAKRGADERAKQLANQAQAVIDKEMKKIPVDAYQQRYAEVGAGFVRPWPKIKTEEYDTFRRDLAEWIIRLQMKTKR